MYLVVSSRKACVSLIAMFAKGFTRALGNRNQFLCEPYSISAVAVGSQGLF